MSQDTLVQVQSLSKFFSVRKGIVAALFRKENEFVHAVDDVSFYVKKGEILGLVGESGSGKTTIALLLLRLLEPTRGRILFEGQDICKADSAEIKKLRLKCSMIFQDPYSSLNPRKTVYDIIKEPIDVHHAPLSGRSRLEAVSEALQSVNLIPPEKYLFKLPSQLSGGERQRVAIARSIVLKPDLIVADEPVSMLDVSIRLSVLHLLLELRRKFGVGYLYITHDLASAYYMCDRIAVMYLGKIVELGDSQTIVRRAAHPYTRLLISAVPVPNPDKRLSDLSLAGEIPSAVNPPPGCRFRVRCSAAKEICALKEPDLIEVEKGHFIACHGVP
jgi:peptide/nickel transport system ATP-binding protein